MKALTTLLILVSINLLGQTSDTLIVNFQTNSYKIEKATLNQIKSFVDSLNSNTRFKIFGHTDDIGSIKANETLSSKREIAVFHILLKSGVDSSIIQHGHFGETKPLQPNDNDLNRAANRRVEIIKYEIKSNNENVNASINNSGGGGSSDGNNGKRVEKIVTQSNGIKIKYMSGTFPPEIEDAIEKGKNPFQLIENTTQMQENNILTTTIDRIELSSLAMFCPPLLNPCYLDSPIVVSIPINNPINCPLENIKFLYSEVEEGKKLWKEANEKIYPEVINGIQYIHVTLFNTCKCINFDYKIEEPCFITDTVYLKFPKAESSYFEVIINSYNSVSQPKLINERIIEVIIPKDKPGEVLIDANFKLNSKNYQLKHVLLTEIPYSEKKKYYYLSKKKIKKEKTMKSIR